MPSAQAGRGHRSAPSTFARAGTLGYPKYSGEAGILPWISWERQDSRGAWRGVCQFEGDLRLADSALKGFSADLAGPLSTAADAVSVLVFVRGQNICKSLIYKMVGAIGFEPTTSWSQTRRSTKLSYTPILRRLPEFCPGRPFLNFPDRSRHSQPSPLQALPKPFPLLCVDLPERQAKAKAAPRSKNYDLGLTYTPRSGRGEGFADTKSLTKPSFERNSTWPAPGPP